MIRICPERDAQCPNGMACAEPCAGSSPKSLTPREKVARIIKEKVSGPHFTDPSLFVAMEQDRFAAADDILTALASGSGDHAELARLARIWSDTSVTNHKMPGDTALVWSRRLEALLAENAALREKVKKLGLAALSWNETATEQLEHRDKAERKLAEAVADKDAAFERLDAEINQHSDTTERLAEAVGLLRDHDDVTRSYDIEPEPGSVSARARTFLSKEAERGCS